MSKTGENAKQSVSLQHYKTLKKAFTIHITNKLQYSNKLGRELNTLLLTGGKLPS